MDDRARGEPEESEMSSRIIHVCLNVRGALMNWRPRDDKGVFRRDDGTLLSPREAKAALVDELARGHELIPIGGPCEGFDHRTGCPGHDVRAEVAKS
jgi:hypothetical protein